MARRTPSARRSSARRAVGGQRPRYLHEDLLAKPGADSNCPRGSVAAAIYGHTSGLHGE